jgi:Tol biopolymer transport system component
VLFASRQSAGFSIDHKFPEDFCWRSDGRVVYAVREPPPNSRDSNLWEVHVDSATGKTATQPRKSTHLAGFHMEGLSASADGRKLLFESSTDQSYVFVGSLGPAGTLTNGRRLTPDERYNTPYGWTRDSRAVVFRSDRTGRFAIYKQRLDEDLPELIASGPGLPEFPRVSPDGSWVIYPAMPDNGPRGESRLMRVSTAGGGPQVILEHTRLTDYSCPLRAGFACVMSEASVDGNQHVFSTFDPGSGERHELFRMTRKPVNWMVSPEGARIAMIENDPQGRIEIRALTGEIQRRIEAKGWPNAVTVDWAADGKSLLISHPGLIDSPSGPIGATLLRVDLDGNVQPLWETRGARYAWAVASPDGRYLAIRGATTSRNAWLIDNF